MEKQLTDTTDAIRTEFENVMNEVSATILKFNEEDFNRVPFEGSWTAGQVAEHLLKSIAGLPKLLKGNTRAIERDPLERCAAIRSVFLDFTAKFQSPEFILPSKEPKQVREFAESFQLSKKAILALQGQEDFFEECTGFSLPGMGELTGWEWICFATAHAIRHTRQLKNIYEKLQA
jgi:hypothetical protein